MSITNCDTHLTRTVRYLSLTFEPVYFKSFVFREARMKGALDFLKDELL